MWLSRKRGVGEREERHQVEGRDAGALRVTDEGERHHEQSVEGEAERGDRPVRAIDGSAVGKRALVVVAPKTALLANL